MITSQHAKIMLFNQQVADTVTNQTFFIGKVKVFSIMGSFHYCINKQKKLDNVLDYAI